MGKRLVAPSVLALLILAFGAGVLAAPKMLAAADVRDWNGWHQLAQLTYLIGVMDTLGVVDLAWREGDLAYFGRVSDWVTKCLAPAPQGRGKRVDLEDVVKKWIKDNPDKRDMKMVIVAIGGIRQMCPR